MKYFSVCLIALLSPLFLLGKTFTVTGIVTDSIGETEPYATVKVYAINDTVKPVAADLTDVDGVFAITLADAGSYQLMVSAVGKVTSRVSFAVSADAPDTNLGSIVLGDAATSLQEITVSAQRPLVSKEIDRIGYDVQADEQSKTSPIIDILKKVPLVMVQPDGTILVNGSSNYKIYRNGRPNASYSQNAKELFKSIPASSIKKIEVITDPGAREDAEGVGAILNIVTMENSSLKGVAGSVSASANSVEWYPHQASTFLTTQIDKFTVSPYFGIYHAKKTTKSESHSEYTYHDTSDKMVSDGASNGKMTSTYWGFDSSLELDTLNLLTFEYSGNRFGQSMHSHSSNAMFDAIGTQLYSYNTATEMPQMSSAYQSFSANYQRSTRRKGETITLSYLIDFGRNKSTNESAYTNVVNAPMPYTGISNISDNIGVEQTVQIDWTRPYGKHHKLDIGGKFINRYSRGKTTQRLVGIDDTFTDFVHNTRVGALYADWRATFDQLQLRAGARYEYSYLGGKYKTGNEPDFSSNFNDVVPNLAVSYNIDDANTVKLAYSMRISRPGINALNPAQNVTPTSVSSGNPYLRSGKYHSLNLNYSFTKSRISADFTASYQFSNNGIVGVSNAINNILYSTYENVGRTRSLSASMYIQWMISEKSSLSLNGRVAYQKYENPGAQPGVTLSNDGFSGYAYAEFTQRLPWRLRATLDLSYWGGGIGGVYNYYRPDGWYAFDHTLSLQRSFLKGDRLTVQLAAHNPFGPGSGGYKSYSINSGMDGMAYSKNFYNTSVQLRVTYRFGSLQAYVKKTKGITNDDKQQEASGSNGK